MFPYLQLAKSGQNQWWKYLLGIIVVFVFLDIVGYIPVELYMDYADRDALTPEQIYDYQINSDFVGLGLDKNLGLIMLLLGSVFGLIAFFAYVMYVHKKSIWDLVNPFQRFRWNRILFSFISLGGITFLLTLGQIAFTDMEVTFQFEWTTFAPLLFISLTLIPVQTSLEEFIFRGYLMQGISLLTRYPYVPLILTSGIFALLHGGNPEVKAFGWFPSMAYYFGFGLFLGILTLMDDGIELALGLHAVNNIMAAILITYNGAVLQTDAIWRASEYHFGVVDVLMSYFIFGIIFGLVYYFFWRKPKEKA